MFVRDSITRILARPTILLGVTALAVPAAHARATHVWECPGQVTADLVGQFEILPRLVVGSAGAAVATLTVEPLANLTGGPGSTDEQCARPREAGEIIEFHVMRALDDAGLPGVVRLTLRVCSSSPGPSEWSTEVTVVPSQRPFRWTAPDAVQADPTGEFRFQASLVVGEGGAYDDYESAWGIENVDGGFSADGFCFPETFAAEGTTLWLDVSARLIDPTRAGTIRVQQGICADVLGGGHSWEAEVRIEPSVSAAWCSFSALKARFSQE